MYAVRYIQLNTNAPSFIFHPHLRLQIKEKRLGREGCYRLIKSWLNV